MREWYRYFNMITGYMGADKEVVVPDSLGGETITIIGKYAFSAKKEKLKENTIKNREEIRKIVLPITVSRIEDYAFAGCKSLTDINLSSVKCIESRAFEDTGIEELSLPSECSFGADAFCRMKKLYRVKMPNDIKSLSVRMFMFCEKLEDVFLSTGLKKIESGMFSDCSSLKTIYLPEQVEIIGDYAFSKCSSLEEIRMPDTIISIEASAFSFCTSLKKVQLPMKLKVVKQWCFSGCKALKHIEFPGRLEVVQGEAFSGCESIKEFDFPSSVKEVDMTAFVGCNNLQKMVFRGAETKLVVPAVRSQYDPEFKPNAELTIVGCKGSSAEKYAITNKLNFQKL